VVYTHRSIVLHSMTIGLADTLGLEEGDVAMPVVPMFHVTAWGVPVSAVLFVTTLVLLGRNFTPKILAVTQEDEIVTVSAGVPTGLLGVAHEFETGNYDASNLTRVACGGSAAPNSLIQIYEATFQMPVILAYGMTETSPVAIVAQLKSY